MNADTEKIAGELIRIARELVSGVRYEISRLGPEHITISGVDVEDVEAVNDSLLKLYSHLGKNKRKLSPYFDLKRIATQKLHIVGGIIVVKTGFDGGDFDEAEKAIKPVLRKLR